MCVCVCAQSALKTLVFLKLLFQPLMFDEVGGGQSLMSHDCVIELIFRIHNVNEQFSA